MYLCLRNPQLSTKYKQWSLSEVLEDELKKQHNNTYLGEGKFFRKTNEGPAICAEPFVGSQGNKLYRLDTVFAERSWTAEAVDLRGSFAGRTRMAIWEKKKQGQYQSWNLVIERK